MLTRSTVRWLVIICWGVGIGLLGGSGVYGQTSTPVPPGGASGGSSAQAPSASAFTGVDVAFVVDQSGSMTGAMRLNTEGSDPDGLRFQSMQFAMEWLGDFRYVWPHLQTQPCG